MFFLRVHSVDTNHPRQPRRCRVHHHLRRLGHHYPIKPQHQLPQIQRAKRHSPPVSKHTTLAPIHGAQSTLLFVVAVPNYLSFNDFIRFCESHLDHVVEPVFIRNDGMEDRYSVLIRLMDQRTSEGFYGSFNGKKYLPGEAEVCHILFLVSVDYTDSAEIARTPPEGCTELPSCPVCLERLDADTSGIATTLCDHSFQCPCLSKWTYLSCQVCRLCQQQDEKPACCLWNI